MALPINQLSHNLAEVEARIQAACESSRRQRSEITLIAVTKGVPLETIQAAYDRGLRNFGESRLQEALPKIERVPNDAHWHFIGPLQSNKAKTIAKHFRTIHSLYKESQLIEIAKADLPISVLLEVNIADEPQKSGLSLAKSAQNSYLTLDEWIAYIANFDQVHLRGLMTIGPNLKCPEAMRPYFRQLRESGKKAGDGWLSMGMSGDFDVAIQEGATHIRVGSALFKGC